jgi:type VI secretion system secreted protein VgrG
MGVNTELGEDELVLVSMSGSEALGRMPTYELILGSDNHDLLLEEVVGQRIAVWLELENQERRYFNGFVSEFQYEGQGQDGMASYHAVMVPWLWFLTRTADCRIFQDKSIPEIIEEVFRDNGQSDFEDRLSGTHEAWNFCVQYRETDFNFVSRLMEQEGIYYYFTHEEDVHSLILCDSPSAHEVNEAADQVPYRPPSEGRAGEEFISSWSSRQTYEPCELKLRDFDFMNPSVALTPEDSFSPLHQSEGHEIFDYPGEFVGPEGDRQTGDEYAQIRLQEIQAEQSVVDASSNARALACGYNFEFIDYDPRPDEAGEYLIIAASYRLDAGSYRAGGEGGSGPEYSCSIRAIDVNKQFRPARITPKPVVQGPQTAIVVGPSGEEILTDEYGRVKVQFHWDRLGQFDQDSSCWMRVSQPWAGVGWGGVSIPRIGQEVIVEFLEGDPDQPIITGRVYNADAMPPYELPAQAVVSGMKSQTVKGGGYNEFIMDDTAGAENMRIHAQFDRNVTIENDNNETIHNNETISVDVDRTRNVGSNETINIGADRTEDVGANETLSVGADRTRSVGAKEKVTIGADQTLDVGANRKKSVGVDETNSIGANRTTNTGASESLTVGGKRTVNVTGDDEVTSGANISRTAASNVVVTSGSNVQILAGSKISLVCGAASITLDAGGNIVLSGVNVTVQAGANISNVAGGKFSTKASIVDKN